MLCCTLVKLSFGEVALLWQIVNQAPQLMRVQLPEADLTALALLQQSYGTVQSGSHPLIDRIGRKLEEYDQGLAINLSLPASEPGSGSEFYRRVWMETSRIARGTVSTYGQLADRISSPRAARAVGTALAANPFPLLIPCHRVIRANGVLGNYSAGGPTVKQRLLAREGVLFDSRGRVMRP